MDEGRKYLAPIRRVFNVMAKGTANLAPQDVVVTISKTPSFATRWLVPRLGPIAEPLFAADLIAVCHPDLALGDKIRSPADLLDHVPLEDTYGKWPLFLDAALDEVLPTGLKTMAFSPTSLAIDAASAWQGVE